MEAQSVEGPPMLRDGERAKWWPPPLGGKVVVETKRLEGVVCDPDSPEHMACLERWFGDKDLGKWMDGADDDSEAQTAEELKVNFENDYANASAQYGDVYLFFREKTSGKPVGFGALYEWNQETASAEVSLMVGEKEFQGRGLGSEIGSALVSVGFDYLKAYSLTAKVVDLNVASFKALTGAGFKSCGILHRSHRYGGRLYNQYMLEALPDDYKSYKQPDTKVYV